MQLPNSLRSMMSGFGLFSDRRKVRHRDTISTAVQGEKMSDAEAKRARRRERNLRNRAEMP